MLYATLNTYDTLAAAGIVPSYDQTYELEAIQAALALPHDGFPVTLRCHGSYLQEIWYHYSVRGPLRHAEPFDESSEVTLRSNTDIFVPTGPDISKSNCPRTGIRYMPKDSQQPTHTTSPPHKPTHSANPTSTPGRPFSGRGHLIVRPISTAPSDSGPKAPVEQQPLALGANQDLQALSETKGCLIRGGLWYASGGCATYLAKTDAPHFEDQSSTTPGEPKPHLFTLSSLYFPCAVVQDTAFKCAKDLGVQTIFEGINVTTSTEDGRDATTREVLAWRGRTTFYADSIPGRFEKVEIFADDDAGRREVQLEVEWAEI
ncbi:Ribonuclease T2-like protein [Cyphellophora attinorum]|uniref:Ribonuclease T2-like protein n=1 Tax=Cyphellophora attinorum TaxID=1664694 RepID=A0A0N1HFY1_9EURO|nr:Ribonuclease T2-like protein [Phialophora attinorum]KPI44290.1 Ribonuclease T2-like protein [Phialophora attinorum]